MTDVADCIVVGSGISGAMAAKGLVDAGATVKLLDIGVDDNLRDQIPDAPFCQIRRTDKSQRLYFLGENYEAVPKSGVKVGAQLTPPRQFIHRRSEELLPCAGETFQPLLPVSAGGLGAGWGAACFTYDQEELARIGIDAPGFARWYQCAADMAGISADAQSPANARLWQGVARHQPPLAIDSNAESILRKAEARREELSRMGIVLGRIPVAILSEDLPPRRANPYFDMDFYSDSRMSVYRPRYTIAALAGRPNFTWVNRRVVLRFEDRAEGVTVFSKNIDTGAIETDRARRVVLCAGALNSARIALHSLGLEGRRTTLLCNPYTYFPTVNLAMLGREARDCRHSLAQIGGTLKVNGGADVYGCFQMYSYRSLLLFKLVKEMPLPVSAGKLACRTLLNSFAIFGIFFADSPADGKYMEIPLNAGEYSCLQINYAQPPAELRKRREHEAIFTRALRRLGCIPMGRFDPGNAGSIHYAGTIPFENPLTPQFHANPDYSIEGAPHVYAGDGASWNYLPAKGLSFTLMAQALRVADGVLRSLR